MSDPKGKPKVKVARVTGNFNRIARDLDRAVSVARFNDAQRFLLDRAREESWSFASGDPIPFALNLSALALVSRFERSHLSRQFAAMVAFRVFEPVGDGSHWINKHYPDWLDARGRPRLSTLQVEWALEITRNGRTVSPATRGPCPPEHRGGVYQTTRSPRTDNTVPPHRQHGPPAQTTRSGPAPQTPIGERARQKSSEELRESSEESSSQSADARETTATREAVPPYPDEDTSPLMIHTGTHPEDPDWARGFWARLWAAFGSARVNTGFYEHQRWHRRECWEAALRKAVQLGARPRSVRYLEAIAGEYDLGGVPPEPAAPAPAGPRPAARVCASEATRLMFLRAAEEQEERERREAAGGQG